MVEREDKVRRGGDLNGARLIEQLKYSISLSTADLAGLLANGWTDARQKALTEWHTKLEASVGVHGFAKSASSKTGGLADSTLTELKRWKLKLTNWAANALGGTEAYDDFKTGTTIGRSARVMNTWLDKALLAVKTHAEALTSEGMPTDWHDQGKTLKEKLASEKAAQQLAIANLPKATADVYVDRAEAYDLLKKLNRLGRNLHIGDREAAARYNLDLLNATGEGPKKKTES